MTQAVKIAGPGNGGFRIPVHMNLCCLKCKLSLQKQSRFQVILFIYLFYQSLLIFIYFYYLFYYFIIFFGGGGGKSSHQPFPKRFFSGHEDIGASLRAINHARVMTKGELEVGTSEAATEQEKNTFHFVPVQADVAPAA